MIHSSNSSSQKFDDYAHTYDAALHQGISVSGEDKDFFASGRVSALAACLAKLKFQARTMLDFGCGIGSNLPFLLEMPGVTRIVGVDISAKSLDSARLRVTSERVEFCLAAKYAPDGQMDLAFCNGVFHHIPPAERAFAVEFIFRSLRPGGLFSFWENNPWNPGTRYVMSRIPFDRQAEMLAASRARRILRHGNFEVLSTHFHFIFPRLLKLFRGLEPCLAPLPFGAQYMVLARKP